MEMGHPGGTRGMTYWRFCTRINESTIPLVVIAREETNEGGKSAKPEVQRGRHLFSAVSPADNASRDSILPVLTALTVGSPIDFKLSRSNLQTTSIMRLIFHCFHRLLAGISGIQ